jgi:hypothetical protein
LIVVSFDPATDTAALAQFRARYGSNAVLVGPYSGKLDNSSESVELVRPDPPQTSGSDAGLVPYVLVDKVAYLDRAPWPMGADGLGQSLQRVSVSGYGNDPTNWVAAAPTPGPSGVTDTDGDGMPDDWENLYGFDPHNPADADQDFDGDGMTNLEEYLAGTHPKQAGSVLRLAVSRDPNSVTLVFNAMAGKTYTVQYCDFLAAGFSWGLLTNVAAQGASQPLTLHDTSLGESQQRFYRIVSPALP